MGPTARRSSAVALAALCGIAPATAWAAGRPAPPGRSAASTTASTASTTTASTASTTASTTAGGHTTTTAGGHTTITVGSPHSGRTTTGATSTSTSLPKPPASTVAARSLPNFGVPKPTIHVTTPEDHSKVVTVNSTVTITSTTRPAHGTDHKTGPTTILYTPDTGYVGPDTFTYSGTIPGSPGTTIPVTGIVDVTVTEVPPTARNATVDTTTGKAVGVDLTALTTVTRGNTATYTVSKPVHGTVTTTSAGAATFTPAAGFTGDGRFTYTVTDNHGGTATATVTVHVTATPTTTTPASVSTTPAGSTGSATPASSAAGSTSPTTAAPSGLAFTGADDAAVGLVGATLVAGGGLLTVLARRRRRHPTWQHLRRS